MGFEFRLGAKICSLPAGKEAEAADRASRRELEVALRQASELFRHELAAKASETHALRHEIRCTRGAHAKCTSPKPYWQILQPYHWLATAIGAHCSPQPGLPQLPHPVDHTP